MIRPPFSQLFSATHTLCTVAVVLRLRLSSSCNIVAPNQARATCTPQSRCCAMDRGTRHGAVAGNSARCCCWQRTPSALLAAPRTIAPPNRPVRAQDASSAGSPPRPCRAGCYPQGPHGNRRTLRRLKRRPAGPIAPCERRLRVPRPPTPESCLIVRSAGGWPADRTAFLRITPKRSPLYHAPNRSCT